LSHHSFVMFISPDMNIRLTYGYR